MQITFQPYKQHKGGYRTLNDWFIVPLIGGLYFSILGFIAVSISFRKKKRLHPLSLAYLLGGLVMFIISYIKY